VRACVRACPEAHYAVDLLVSVTGHRCLTALPVVADLPPCLSTCLAILQRSTRLQPFALSTSRWLKVSCAMPCDLEIQGAAHVKVGVAWIGLSLPEERSGVFK
jgi:hypothetical protein